jgi:hypothetical protein
MDDDYQFIGSDDEMKVLLLELRNHKQSQVINFIRRRTPMRNSATSYASGGYPLPRHISTPQFRTVCLDTLDLAAVKSIVMEAPHESRLEDFGDLPFQYV